jgi:peptidyl-prolyl cis-trans isomerase-like protein 2
MKEWTEDFGGKREGEARNPFKPLPFYCCSLSLQPFEDPVCTEDGIVFDLVHIIPYLKKYKKDPISGKPLQAKDLIKLQFHKNANGEYHCPITFKVFTDFTHIVAIRTSGHVYSMEAIEELNIRAKNWNCIMSGTPFTRKDIISIQDPQNLEKRNWANFEHIRDNLKLDEEQEADPTANINLNEATARIIRQVAEKGKEEADKSTKPNESSSDKAIATTSSTTAPSPSSKPTSASTRPVQAVAAPSFTCSSFTATDLKKPHPADAPPKQTKKKGYVRLHTNLGDLNLELHCDIVPKTCENFLELCEAGYYNNTVFHRLIKNFMIQGGDPTGTGRGGESIWKKSFKDDFKPNLLHSGRGILSMANSGPNTNNSQFFITFKAASWLNNKHTVFGHVVGGMETLKLMEAVSVDDKDRPIHDIKITGTDVFANPFRHLEEEAAEQRKKEEDKKKKEDEKYDEANRGLWYSNPVPALPKTGKTGVGKYLSTSSTPTPALKDNNTKKRELASDLSSLPPTKKTLSVNK